MYLGALQLHLMAQNLKAVKAFKSHIIPGKFMYPVGYGIPAIIVMVSACVYPGGYGTQNACWLNLNQEFRWSFIGPVCFVIMINLILFIITINMLQEKLSSVNKDVSTINNTRVLLFKAVSQFLVLGCTWILGIFQIQKETLVMAYIFTILNSFHGVFMFLLYCLSNKQVVDEYKTWLRKQFNKIRKGREFEISTTTAATVSTWTSQSQISTEKYNIDRII
ncbi:adhesion G protein-coupled receptor E3-like [Protopterus annectens]|uniref:adhesion G protein-coupled receptor E3-like n=1 Tax=Protopterus annectens TaxID=7888 RepID=UPI001CFA5426|nr:adhesion G protein-coupled receptor E3-like [Protopterus annectens]